MRKNSKIITIIFISVFIISNISCDTNSDDMKAPTPIPMDTKTNGENTETSNKTRIEIKSSDGNSFAEIAQNGQISFGGKQLTKRQKNAEKVIYSVDGNEIAEVKTKDADGFKVRNLDGSLLWKIKIQDDKIKISDNEENENPFEIKKKDDGAKIVQNETDIGKVKFDSESKKLKVKDANDKEVFISNAESYSAAYGVLLLDKIPLEQRLIIISELISRNL